MPALELRLLGTFQLTHNGETVTTVNQPRLQSLLAYLVLHRAAPQSRQHLAFTFWPDATESLARNNLRQLLFQLRHAVPDGSYWLQSDSNAVWWISDTSLRFDVADYQCVTLLEAELGVEPGEQVRAAYVQLREQGTCDPAGSPPHQSARTPLIGRHPEWQRLRAAWQRASGGQVLCTLISGEAGIGKTRLADELLDWAGQQGAIVARTRAYAAEGRLTYGAITEWLRSGALFGALRQLDEIWLSEIARLLPELLIEHPHLAPPGPLTERWQRQRFFQALARGVMASSAPLALQFDDLQWCDQETLEWLHFLLRFDPSARLLLVGTLRIEERRDNPTLVALLQALRRTDQLIEISLAPLDAVETARMAAIIAGRAVEVGEALRLFSETEGNPLFITEMAQAPLSRAVATGADATQTPPQLADPSMPLPPVVYTVIAGRLGQLSPDAHVYQPTVASVMSNRS